MNNKIIESYGQYVVKFIGHSIDCYSNSFDIIKQISKEQEWTIEETVDKLIYFILSTLQDNKVIHY